MQSVGTIILFGAYLYFCSSVIFSQDVISTTHHPHGSSHKPHREPIELDSVYFQYDPHSHFLIAKTHDYCYLLPLDTNEQQLVHTSSGLRNLEVHMFHLLNYGVHESLTGHDVMLIGSFGRFCNNQTMVKIHD